MNFLNPRVAVYPGSFDPITNGHIDIIERISEIYDQVIVLIAKSSAKTSYFSTEDRVRLAKGALKNLANVEVEAHEGLVVHYMRQKGIRTLVRGLRAVTDFEYEMSMASMNKKLAPEVETVLVFARPEFYYISSRGVKEVAFNGGSLEGLVPALVSMELSQRISQKESNS